MCLIPVSSTPSTHIASSLLSRGFQILQRGASLDIPRHNSLTLGLQILPDIHSHYPLYLSSHAGSWKQSAKKIAAVNVPAALQAAKVVFSGLAPSHHGCLRLPTQPEEALISLHASHRVYADPGTEPDLPPNCTVLTEEELSGLHPVLKRIISARTGQINLEPGVRALVFKSNSGAIHCSFSGTRPNLANLATDMMQVVHIPFPYYIAAGTVKLLMKSMTGGQLRSNHLIVSGHSLGGGMALFAGTMNRNYATPTAGLSVYTFNPAGLFVPAQLAIGAKRLRESHPSILNFRMDKDAVSLLGGLPGQTKTLAFHGGETTGESMLITSIRQPLAAHGILNFIENQEFLTALTE